MFGTARTEVVNCAISFHHTSSSGAVGAKKKKGEFARPYGRVSNSGIRAWKNNTGFRNTSAFSRKKKKRTQTEQATQRALFRETWRNVHERRKNTYWEASTGNVQGWCDYFIPQDIVYPERQQTTPLVENEEIPALKWNPEKKTYQIDTLRFLRARDLAAGRYEAAQTPGASDYTFVSLYNSPDQPPVQYRYPGRLHSLRFQDPAQEQTVIFPNQVCAGPVRSTGIYMPEAPPPPPPVLG